MVHSACVDAYAFSSLMLHYSALLFIIIVVVVVAVATVTLIAAVLLDLTLNLPHPNHCYYCLNHVLNLFSEGNHSTIHHCLLAIL
jgi:hypothetical protein